MSFWTSDNIELTGFNREKSVFDEHTNSFTKLVFNLSYAASDEWVDFFDVQTTLDGFDKLDFNALEVSTAGYTSVHLNGLQNYILELKEIFNTTNEYFNKKKKTEHNKKLEVENVINNLKF